MSSYAERAFIHKYIEVVWCITADGTKYWVPADGCWDIIFARQSEGNVRVFIAGPMTKARLTQHAKGTELFGIRFKASVYIPQLPLSALLNSTTDLHYGHTRSPIRLEGAQYDIPTDETAELFVDKLCKNGMLSRDLVVDRILEGQTAMVSPRSVQRHFAQTTGLTKQFIEQTKRVQLAEQLLRQGELATRVATQVGYADQAHMTRSFRALLGYTPSQLLNV